MRRVTAYRANRILFNFIKSNSIQGEAIVPANLCQSVVDTLQLTGLNLIFADISADSLCIDEKAVIKKAKEVSLVLFVHTYGIEMACPKWFTVVREINPHLAIIDDRCLCTPQLTLEDSSADLVLFSTCKKKQVDLGTGGIGFLSDKWTYCDVFVESSATLSNDVWYPDFDMIQQRLQESTLQKDRLNSIYRDSLPIEIQLPKEFQNWRFNIIVPNKEQILESLFSDGLFASSHYRSLSDQCRVAVNLHKGIVNLFNDFYYSEEQAIKTCELINNMLKRRV